MGRFIRWIITHGVALALGVALGIYLLPILTAPPAPPSEKLQEMADQALFSGELEQDLAGNDFVHWGEGTISVSASEITHQGKLAPGPDYKLYLTRGLVEHEDRFDRGNAILVGDVKSFSGFILSVPEGVDVQAYDSVLIWCEAFGEFIAAGTYQ